MAGRKIQNADDAARCLAAARASGSSRTHWAHAHGIDARSLNAWRLNLERSTPIPALRLVEILPATSPATVGQVRCGAFTVEVVGGFDAHELGRLLRVVAAAC